MNLDAFLLKSKFLDEEIQTLQHIINQSPKGSLISRKKSDGSYEYYQSVKDPEGKKKEIYLHKSDNETALGLAEKEYSLLRLKEAKKEKRIIDELINLDQNEKSYTRYLRQHPGAASLLIPAFEQKTPYAQQWKKYPYVRNDKHPEGLIVPTVVPDLNVRSKAEADIVSRLVHFGVPYRYEEEYVIDGIPFHPDFTCLNVKTNQVFFWEHQGRWDDPNYVRQLERRNLHFQKAGIIPWKNLIITTETSNQPLDIRWVDNLIQYYLL